MRSPNIFGITGHLLKKPQASILALLRVRNDHRQDQGAVSLSPPHQVFVMPLRVWAGQVWWSSAFSFLSSHLASTVIKNILPPMTEWLPRWPWQGLFRIPKNHYPASGVFQIRKMTPETWCTLNHSWEASWVTGSRTRRHMDFQRASPASQWRRWFSAGPPHTWTHMACTARSADTEHGITKEGDTEQAIPSPPWTHTQCRCLCQPREGLWLWTWKSRVLGSHTHCSLLTVGSQLVIQLPDISEPQGFMCETAMRKTYLFEVVVKIIQGDSGVKH